MNYKDLKTELQKVEPQKPYNDVECLKIDQNKVNKCLPNPTKTEVKTSNK